MQIICGVIRKIIFQNADFYILGIEPLCGDIEVDYKFKTFTAKGNLTQPVREEDIVTVTLSETIHQQYGKGYNIEYLSNEYPNNTKDQMTILKKLIIKYGNHNDMRTYKETTYPEEPYKIFTTLDFSEYLLSKLMTIAPPDQYRKWASQYDLTPQQLTSFSNACKSIQVPIDALEENIAKALYNTHVNVKILISIITQRHAKNQTTPDRDDAYLFDMSVRDVMIELMTTGDTIIPYTDVRRNTMALRGMQSTTTFDTLMKSRPNNSYIITVNDNIMLESEYSNELAIYSHAKNNRKYPNQYDSFITYLKSQNIELTDEQLQFATNVFTSDMIALTGGAGTGKSFTIATVIKYLMSVGNVIACTAPTAKAAKVLKDYTGINTSTIHSFLAQEQECDYLFIDESSMIDSQLSANIIEYVEEIGCTLIMSGDISQLPPIGAGAPYRDILMVLDSVTTLTKTFRQKDKSLIDVLTQARNGEFNINATNEWQNYGDSVVYKHYSNTDEITNVIINNIKTSGLTNIGIISPINKVVDEINNNIQEAINPNSDVVVAHNTRYGVNDPVILKKNKEYATDKNLEHALPIKNHLKNTTQKYMFYPEYTFKTVKAYNGDTGKVIKVLNDTQFLVELDDTTYANGEKCIILFDANDGRDVLTCSQVSLGYAITVHKAQGSQYKTVIFVCPTTRQSMTSRPMIYTALSRAKENIIILTQTRFSNIPIQRNTYISETI